MTALTELKKPTQDMTNYFFIHPRLLFELLSHALLLLVQ